ncbi:MAG TPA: hypothetical protein VGR27_06800, partial [Longimicrobiaceae bacterium]|nr:hypothetical protein [Longimicrobiaceae bacterium]
VMETFSFGERPLELFAGASQRYAYAVVREANAVYVIDGGIWEETGGGELLLHMQQPRVLDFTIAGSLPTHSMMNGHWFATFQDGTGEAKLFDERTLIAGSPNVVTIPTGRVHHGMVAPLEGAIIVTIPPTRVGGNGVGLEVFNATGQRQASFPGCSDPHGAAATDMAAFGCGDGILLLRRSGGEWSGSKQPYPAEYTGMYLASAQAHRQLPYVVAYLKVLTDPAQAVLVRIDGTTGAMTQIPVPGRATSQEYAFDASGRYLLVIGLDGALHVFNASDLTLRGSVPAAATAQADPLPASGIRWPTVAAGEKFAYVADPATGTVAEVNLQTLQVVRRINVGGSPMKLALLGTDRTGHKLAN